MCASVQSIFWLHYKYTNINGGVQKARATQTTFRNITAAISVMSHIPETPVDLKPIEQTEHVCNKLKLIYNVLVVPCLNDEIVANRKPGFS